MSNPQYIESVTVGETQLILWNMGNYQYQIETKTKGNTEVFNFEAEYNDAICEFIHKVREVNNKMA